MTRAIRAPLPGDSQLFHTFATASALCGVSQDVLKLAVREGRLRGKRTGANGGGLYLFSRKQLEDWFKQLEDA